MTRWILVWTLSGALLASCSCEQPTEAHAVTVLEWGAERRHISGLTEGETLGTDTEQRRWVVWTPEPLTGVLDPTLEELELEITYTVGSRRMSAEASAGFTATVPVSARIQVIEAGRWQIEPRCNETIGAPLPRMDEHGVGAYADGTDFWESCTLELHRGTDLEYSMSLEIHGDGELEAHAPSGAVTVSSR